MLLILFQTNKTYLERNMKESEDNLRELIMSKQRKWEVRGNMSTVNVSLAGSVEHNCDMLWGWDMCMAGCAGM